MEVKQVECKDCSKTGGGEVMTQTRLNLFTASLMACSRREPVFKPEKLTCFSYNRRRNGRFFI